MKFEKFKNSFLFFILSTFIFSLIIPCLVACLVAYLTANYINPGDKPELVTTITWHSGEWVVPPGSIKLKIKDDRKPFVFMSVKNEGSGGSKSLHIEIKLSKNHFVETKEPNPKKNYIPHGLAREVVDGEVTQTTFYEKFGSFPAGDTLVEYTFQMADFVKSKDELIPTVMDSSMNWIPEIQFDYIMKKLSVAPSFTSIAWASGGDGGGGERTNWAENDSIGGYRPVIMGKEMARLFLEKGLITPEGYDSVLDILNYRKQGAVFGGVDILALAKRLLRILVDNQTISESLSADIMKKAHSAGGILTMGYNVIILQVGILDALVLNAKITLKEGQRVVDKAQAKNDVRDIH